MSSIKIHREMQVAVALYFRFVRMHNVFGLEVRHAKRGKTAKIADFASSDGTQISEVEIKTNRDDLVRDLRRKSKTHDHYRQVKKGTPNYFYFAVHPDIVTDAKGNFDDTSVREIAARVNANYGLMVVDIPKYGVAKEAIKVIKYPRKLSEQLSREYYNSILDRQSSMVANYLSSEANTFTYDPDFNYSSAEEAA